MNDDDMLPEGTGWVVGAAIGLALYVLAIIIGVFVWN